MLGIYNYTVALTYLGTLIAFAGVALTLRGSPHSALLCLLLAGTCDMFDGKVASTKADRTVQEKRFGIQIDSLSDLVSFGVLPSAIVYTISQGNSLSFFVAGMYMLCALIRLAWFNVDEEERQTETADPRQSYLGLPVTSSALILPAVIGFSQIRGWSETVLGTVALAGMAAAFLTPFHLKKPELLGKLGMLACGGAGLAVLLLAGMDL